MKLETLLSFALCLVLIFFSSFATDEKSKKYRNRGGVSAFHTYDDDDENNLPAGTVEYSGETIASAMGIVEAAPTGARVSPQYADPTAWVDEYLAFIPPMLNYSGSTCIPSSSEFTIYNTLKNKKISITSITSDNIQFNLVFNGPYNLNAEENITITVIFLPYNPDDKILGTLHIEAIVDNSNEDGENESLSIQYSIVGTAKVNNYRIYPLLGHQTYVGTTYEQSISIFNAYEESLQIREIFTTELFISLKNILGHEHTITSLQPGAYKEIIMLSLATSVGGNHTGYVHIKTNYDDIVIPVSIFVVDSGLVSLPTAIDFGTLIAVNEQKTVSVMLMNKGTDALLVHNIMTQYDDPNLVVSYTSQRVLHPVSSNMVDVPSFISIYITYTASKAEKIKNTLLITTNHSNPILAVKEIDIEGAVLLGGIGYDKEQIVFSLPIMNVTCPQVAASGVVQRDLVLINYFQDPVAINVVTVSGCNSFITTSIGKNDFRNQVIGSTDNLQPIPLTFHQELAIDYFDMHPDSLPYTCWLEVWTNISSHRIPLHIVNGALTLAFTDATMFDAGDTGALDTTGNVDTSDDDVYKYNKLRRDNTFKYCNSSDDGQGLFDEYMENSDVYSIDMGQVSIRDPRPLRLAYVNNNPINIDLELLSADGELCICYEASWPAGMSDDAVAIAKMNNIADRTYQQAMNDKQKCSCNSHGARVNGISVFNCKVGYISLFSIIFHINGDTLMAGNFVDSFMLGSVYQHIHVFAHMQLHHVELTSNLRSSVLTLGASGQSSIVMKQLYEGPPVETTDIITKIYLSNASAVYSCMNRIESSSIFNTHINRENDSNWETVIELGSSNLFDSIKYLVSLYMTENSVSRSADDSSIALTQLVSQLASGSTNTRNLEQLSTIRSTLFVQFPDGIPLKSLALLTYTPYSLHHHLIENIKIKLPVGSMKSQWYLPSVHSASLRSENIMRNNDYFIFYIKISNPFIYPVTVSLTLSPTHCFSNASVEMVPNYMEISSATINEKLSFIERSPTDGDIEYVVDYDDQAPHIMTSLKGWHLLKANADLDLPLTHNKAFVISQDVLRPHVLVPDASKFVGPILFVPSATNNAVQNIIQHNLGLSINNNFTADEYVRLVGISAAVNFSVHSLSSFKYSHNVNNKLYLVERVDGGVAQATVNITTFDDTLFTLQMVNYGSTAITINKIYINNSTLYYSMSDRERINSLEELPVYVPVGGTKSITLALTQSDVCLFTGKVASLELLLDSGDVVRIQIQTRIIKSLLHACQNRNISYNSITLGDILVLIVVILWIGLETKYNAAIILRNELMYSSSRGSTSSTVSSIATLFKASKKKFPVNSSGKREKIPAVKKSAIDTAGNKSRKSSNGSEDLHYLLCSHDTTTARDAPVLKAVDKLLEKRSVLSENNGSSDMTAGNKEVVELAQVLESDLLDSNSNKACAPPSPVSPDSSGDTNSFKAYNPFGDRSLLEEYPHSSFGVLDSMYVEQGQSLSSPMDSADFINITSPATAAADFSWFSKSSEGLNDELNEYDRLFSDINLVINNDYIDDSSSGTSFYFSNSDQISDHPPGFPQSPPQRRKASFDVAGYLAGLGNSPTTKSSIAVEKRNQD